MSKALPKPPANAHRMTYRIPYSETDAMARVYYANYLVWFERARTEMLRSLDYAYRDLEARGIYLPVRQCNVRYFGYGEYDDLIELCSWISNLRRARVEFTTMALKNDVPITVGVVELACVGQKGKPVQFPDDVQDVFSKFLDDGNC